MNNIQHHLILAIAPCTKGFGFAVLEGEERLVNWGVKTVTGDKNKRCLLKVKEMISQYEPDVIVLQDCSAKNSRRSPRIQKLSQKIIQLSRSDKLRVALFSRNQVNQFFFPDGQGTKYTLAEIIAQRFPNEVGFLLPGKRKLGDGEDSRMYIFDAVALALISKTIPIIKEGNS